MCNQRSRQLWFHPGQGRCDEVPSPQRPKMRLILLGPPGVGKGTQAELLCRRFRACHLSTGDLFRSASCESELSPAMQVALDAMRRGELVSDELVMDLVRERSMCLACHGGFLLDGVPRTLPQAQALVELFAQLNVAVDGVILYELAEEAIASRICGRRTCAACKSVFHVETRPPAVANVCDNCGGVLIQRDDDRPDVVRTRLAAYRQATQPLCDFYSARGELIMVSADGGPEDVFERTCEALAAYRITTPCE